MIAATKLDADDEVVGVIMLSASDVLTGTKKVILLTKDGLSLGFPLSEVSELKKDKPRRKRNYIGERGYSCICNGCSSGCGNI
ncbi:MAG: hypothetical protein ACLU22_05875 [Clostridium sp.]